MSEDLKAELEACRLENERLTKLVDAHVEQIEAIDAGYSAAILEREASRTQADALAGALERTADALKRRCNSNRWHNDPLVYDTIRQVVEPALASHRPGSAKGGEA